MPADLVPNEAIPALAAKIDSPDMLKVLRLVAQFGPLQNSPELDQQTQDFLSRMVQLGLVDPGYSGPTYGPPDHWVVTGNGDRVLRHFTTQPADDDAPQQEVGTWLS